MVDFRILGAAATRRHALLKRRSIVSRNAESVNERDTTSRKSNAAESLIGSRRAISNNKSTVELSIKPQM